MGGMRQYLTDGSSRDHAVFAGSFFCVHMPERSSVALQGLVCVCQHSKYTQTFVCEHNKPVKEVSL